MWAYALCRYLSSLVYRLRRCSLFSSWRPSEELPLRMEEIPSSVVSMPKLNQQPKWRFTLPGKAEVFAYKFLKPKCIPLFDIQLRTLHVSLLPWSASHFWPPISEALIISDTFQGAAEIVSYPIWRVYTVWGLIPPTVYAFRRAKSGWRRLGRRMGENLNCP